MASTNVELATGPDGTPLWPSSSPVGFTASQIRAAYGIDSISIGGVAGTGAGQTIAIVNAYNDPKIVADVAAFNNQFSLQQFNVSGGPTLTVLDQNGNVIPDQTGNPKLPGNATKASGAKGSWSVEESLDVEWAHAIAPQANIILFEASSNSISDVNTAIGTAAATNGVSVVSMSFGPDQFAGGKTGEEFA